MATDETYPRLKQCPFCGREARWSRPIYRGSACYRVECGYCRCCTDYYPSQRAANAWNRRIGEHDEQEEEAAQEADREPEEEAGEVEEETSSPQEWGCDV